MRHAFALVVLPLAVVACQQAERPAADPVTAAEEEFFTAEDYDRVDKIDLHAHIHAEDG